MLGRLKETVGDVAETIKRAFAGPTVYSASHFKVGIPECKALEMPTASTAEAQLLISPDFAESSLSFSATATDAVVQFQTRTLLETGEVFKADANLVKIPLVWAKTVKSGGIPKMNSPEVKRIDDKYSSFKTISYALPPFALVHGKIYTYTSSFKLPLCYGSVAVAFSRPIRIRSENIEKISKALLMRYTLQLVKESGENARNLEIFGVFRIPKKGVRDVKHDVLTGLLRILVGSESRDSPYCKLILARKKNGHGVVNCTLDED